MNATIASLLEGHPVVIALPVQWGDQDAFGHVNNTVYFRWFESSRIAYGDRMGLTRLYDDRKIGPILAAISCNYRRQLKHPDTVHIGARVARIGRSSLTMEHRIVSAALQTVVADGSSTIVTFDYAANRPVPVPDDLRKVVEHLEAGQDKSQPPA